MRFERSAGAIIYRISPDQKIEYLLLKHQDDYWNFPKGKLEKGENDHQAAIREIREEAGIISVEFIPGFKIKSRYVFRAPERNYEWTFKTVIYYLAEVDQTQIAISREHQGFAWLELEDALERTKNIRSIQKMIIKADNFINNNEKL
jgi:bis(5'-nucleosidyl)-tetraphosphatase